MHKWRLQNRYRQAAQSHNGGWGMDMQFLIQPRQTENTLAPYLTPTFLGGNYTFPTLGFYALPI